MSNNNGLQNLTLTITKIQHNLNSQECAILQNNLDNYSLQFTKLILSTLSKSADSFSEFEEPIFIFSYILSLNKGHKYGFSYYSNKAKSFSKQLSDAQYRAKSICNYFQEHINSNNDLKGLKFIFDDLFIFETTEPRYDACINVKNISNLFKPLKAPFHVKIEQYKSAEISHSINYERLVKSLEELDLNEYITYVKSN